MIHLIECVLIRITRDVHTRSGLTTINVYLIHKIIRIGFWWRADVSDRVSTIDIILSTVIFVVWTIYKIYIIFNVSQIKQNTPTHKYYISIYSKYDDNRVPLLKNCFKISIEWYWSILYHYPCNILALVIQILETIILGPWRTIVSLFWHPNVGWLSRDYHNY